ncbi:hypothetical protein [Vulcanococcus sp.]|jgi:hypothetical protein|uniref:hypothetical protein n=1 Tax=Vulcanococcus sp. TaxID=2856995 RepID=UPI00322FBC79
MQRPIPWLWIAALSVLLLAPGLAGRLFVDVLEGITLLLVFGPLVLAGAGFLAWQWFKRRVINCPVCGTPSVGSPVCPACGADLSGVSPAASSAKPETKASDAVVDVQVTDITGDK